MNTCLRWLLPAVLLMYLPGLGARADEVCADEKGTFLGALFGTRTEAGKASSGAVITHVLPSSPASRADLRRNDVVLEYDRTLVRDGNHLARLIRADKPERKVQLVVLRGTRRQNVDVTLALGPALKLAEGLALPRTEPAEVARTSKPASVCVRATPLDSGKVQWTIEYMAATGKKVYTCEGAAAELTSTLQKLPQRERQLVRIALERLRALDKPRAAASSKR
jgi:hypothetical protein